MKFWLSLNLHKYFQASVYYVNLKQKHLFLELSKGLFKLVR